MGRIQHWPRLWQQAEVIMFRIIGTTIAVCGLLLSASPAAEAHGAARHGHGSHGYTYYRYDIHRDYHMPRWLWHKRGFRHWYFRTPLRFDRRLSWWQLYDRYRWERKYTYRRYHRPYHGPRYRDYEDYRRHGPDHERRHRGHRKDRRGRDDD